MKLTEKQRRFADYYIQSGNATEAAIRAGYSKKTARSIAAENLAKPYITDYIHAQNRQLADDRIADMKEIKQFWSEILRGKVLDRDNEAALIKDKLKASEFLAKTNGAFLDRVEHSGAIEIEVDIEEDEDGE